MKKFFFGAAAAMLSLALLSWYWSKEPEQTNGINDGRRPVITTTFFPAYDIARHLAGDRYEVVGIVPPGADVHHFEPSPDTIALVNDSSLFIHGGAMLEPWAQELSDELGLGRRALDLSADVALLDAEGRPIAASAKEARTAYDPHYWLDIDNLATMTEAIRSALETIDPDGSVFYSANAGGYLAALSRLDDEFKTGLMACRQRTIVLGGHRTFAYLARRYGLELLSVEGLDPEAEVRPEGIADAIEKIRASGQSAVFSEELINDRLAATIADETGAGILYLHGLHNLSMDDQRLGVSAFDLLANDLSQLKTGLDCR